MVNSSSEGNSIYISSLLKRLKTTGYAKFDAHKQYVRLNNSSLLALTTSSLLLIFVSIINKYTSIAVGYEDKIELIVILVSIIILILSLVVSLSSYSLKSERFLRSGNEILDLFERLNLLDKEDSINLKTIVNEYSVLRKNTDNHSDYNYRRGRLVRRREENKLNKSLSSEKASLYDNYCYWSSIIFFKVISICSIVIFFSLLIWAFYYAESNIFSKIS